MEKVESQLQELVHEIRTSLSSFNFKGFIVVNVPIEDIKLIGSAPDIQMRVFPINNNFKIFRQNDNNEELKNLKQLIFNSNRLLSDFFFYNNLTNYSKIENAKIFEIDLDKSDVEWKSNKYILNANENYTISFDDQGNPILSEQLCNQIEYESIEAKKQ